MCGLVGVASSRLTLEDLKYLKAAIICDTVRGADGTGIIAASADQKPFLYKRAVDGHTFVNSKPYGAMTTEVNKHRGDVALMAHNRHATMGEVDTKSSHPFRHNHILGMHNGTLDWHYHLPNGKDFDVDSEAIIYALSVTKDPLSVLEDLPGAFALTWYNTLTNKLYIARNDERPLTIATSKDSSTILWGSEEGMVTWLINRSYSNKYFLYEDLPVGELWSYDLDTHKQLASTKEVVNFTPSEDRWAYTYNYGSNNYSRATTSSKKYPNLVDTASTSSTATMIKVDSVGLLEGDDEEVVLEKFKYYSTNPHSITGKAYGYLKADSSIAIEVNCDDEFFSPGKVVIAKLPTTFSSRNNKEFLLCYNPRNVKEKKDEAATISTADGNIKVSRFEELIKDGCGYCSSSIWVNEAPRCTVYDFGTHPSVLCPDCTRDKPWEGEIYDS